MDQNNFNAGAPRPFRSHSHTSNHNNHNSAHSGHQTPMRHSLPTCMALVDARYVGWLSGKPNGLMNRSAFASVLAQALPNAGVHAQLVRTYWYTESDDGMLVDDQCVRLVANDLHNEGGPTLSAMVRDLNALAQRGGCVHVVIASDDERLIAAIDEARLSGMRVHTLCDESVQNFATFSKNEPDLARLVRAGDRRIIVARGELTQAASAGAGKAGADTLAPSIDASKTMQEVAQAWWDKCDSHERDDLRETVPHARGLPQDVDRTLLSAGRDELNRPLTTGERHLLRKLARDLLLGDPDVAAGVTAGGQSTDD